MFPRVGLKGEKSLPARTAGDRDRRKRESRKKRERMFVPSPGKRSRGKREIEFSGKELSKIESQRRQTKEREWGGRPPEKRGSGREKRERDPSAGLEWGALGAAKTGRYFSLEGKKREGRGGRYPTPVVP